MERPEQGGRNGDGKVDREDRDPLDPLLILVVLLAYCIPKIDGGVPWRGALACFAILQVAYVLDRALRPGRRRRSFWWSLMLSLVGSALIFLLATLFPRLL